MVFKAITFSNIVPPFKLTKIIDLYGDIIGVRKQPDKLLFLPVFEVITIGVL